MQLSDPQLERIVSKIHNDLISGLLYTHTRINANTSKNLESTSFLYALIELLNEKGFITIEELDERKKAIAQRLVAKFTESGLGLMYQDPEYDKYTFKEERELDCGDCTKVCRAVCCKLPFALSRQDVDEGIIRWEFGRPYLIAHDPDGYCVHLDRETCKCAVHEHRPVPCRGFDCKGNEKWKVWLDHERKIINHELVEKIDRDNAGIYSHSIRK